MCIVVSLTPLNPRVISISAGTVKIYTPPTQCQLKSKNYVILPFSLVNKYLGQETGSCLGSFDTGVNYLQLIAAHLIDGHRINAVIHLMDFQFIIRHWRNKKSTQSPTEV